MSKRMLFGLAALLLLVAGLYSWGLNTRAARQQADHIVSQDGAGVDTTAAQAALKAYVAAHMGASVDYMLTGSYMRAQAAAAAAATASTASSQIYAQAQAACSGKSDSITQAHCNQAYISSHLANVPPPAPVPQPKSADYQVDLRAPFWTPDLAGALLLGAAAALALGLLASPRRRRHR